MDGGTTEEEGRKGSLGEGLFSLSRRRSKDCVHPLYPRPTSLLAWLLLCLFLFPPPTLKPPLPLSRGGGGHSQKAKVSCYPLVRLSFGGEKRDRFLLFLE